MVAGVLHLARAEKDITFLKECLLTTISGNWRFLLQLFDGTNGNIISRESLEA